MEQKKIGQKKAILETVLNYVINSDRSSLQVVFDAILGKIL